MTKKYAISCFSVKKLISTSKRHGEHPFAGRNTQHSTQIKLLGTDKTVLANVPELLYHFAVKTYMLPYASFG